MKRRLFPVLVLALILPALTGCPTGNEDDPGIPSGNLGDGNLVLEGTVYTQDFDKDTYKLTYKTYTTGIEVEVYANGSDKLGGGAVTNGTFKITVEKPANLAGFDDMGSFFSGWKNPTAAPADGKGAMISLRVKDTSNQISKTESDVSVNGNGFSGTTKSVEYVYVDKDVTITLGKGEDKNQEDGYSWEATFNAAILKLNKGWNALYTESTVTGNETSESYTTSISVGNPDLKWVIYLSNDE
jgi:hypothetical protein